MIFYVSNSNQNIDSEKVQKKTFFRSEKLLDCFVSNMSSNLYPSIFHLISSFKVKSSEGQRYLKLTNCGNNSFGTRFAF